MQFGAETSEEKTSEETQPQTFKTAVAATVPPGAVSTSQHGHSVGSEEG